MSAVRAPLLLRAIASRRALPPVGPSVDAMRVRAYGAVPAAVWEPPGPAEVAGVVAEVERARVACERMVRRGTVGRVASRGGTVGGVVGTEVAARGVARLWWAIAVSVG